MNRSGLYTFEPKNKPNRPVHDRSCIMGNQDMDYRESSGELRFINDFSQNHKM